MPFYVNTYQMLRKHNWPAVQLSVAREGRWLIKLLLGFNYRAQSVPFQGKSCSSTQNGSASMLALRLSPFAHAAMRPLCASSRAYLSSSWRDALSNIPQTVTAFVTSSSGSGRRRPSDLLEYSDEVREALDRGLPLVALESTIISHGMPYPRNLEVARQIEETVRRHGAVPATVAIIGGQPKVGLGAADLETLARNTAGEVMKASRRDLGFAITNKRHAATTVASTMILAHLAGIRVFATGGIGGVHRGAEATMDVSADLQELARVRKPIPSL